MTYSTDGHADVQSWLRDGNMEPIIPLPNSFHCHYRANTDFMAQDVRAIPAVDYYGNATNGGSYVDSLAYQTHHIALDLNQTNSGYDIDLASWNAADRAAYRIRHDPNLGVLIYSIGLNQGMWPPDPVLMLRMSNINNPQNHIYESGLPEGLYVMAPTTAELNAAFAKVASEILRLSM